MMLMIPLLLTTLAAPVSPHCGTERWPAKTLTDGEASAVLLSPAQEATVEQLAAVPAPKYSDANPRAALEKTVYSVDGEVVGYKFEADKDIHVVLRGSTGQTMIIEFTDPACAVGSRVVKQMATAREQFLNLVLKPMAKYRHLATPVRVTVTGVGFFDKIHGQIGVAPNGAELHPVLSVVPAGE